MKATEQYFHVILFIVLYKAVLTFTSIHETLVCVQMKTIEQYLLIQVVSGLDCTIIIIVVFSLFSKWEI